MLAGSLPPQRLACRAGCSLITMASTVPCPCLHLPAESCAWCSEPSVGGPGLASHHPPSFNPQGLWAFLCMALCPHLSLFCRHAQPLRLLLLPQSDSDCPGPQLRRLGCHPSCYFPMSASHWHLGQYPWLLHPALRSGTYGSVFLL